MAVPDYQSVMLPLLRFAEDGNMHFIRDATDKLADHFKLTEEERKQLLPSGTQAVFGNRVGWVRTYLKKAGLLETPKRGYFQITQRGADLLRSNPTQIDNSVLERYPEFVEFQSAGKNKSKARPATGSQTYETPDEAIEAAYQDLRDGLAGEILAAIKSCSPTFFEQLVVDLLVRMGYGGSRQDAGQAIGKSGDEGIDGIIKEDRLGLDKVFIQAKRWDAVVGRPEIQKFAGALQGQRARKGIFISTSNFSKAAWDYVSRIDSRIVLIDGDKLAQYMIDFNVGVSIVASYEIKRIDSDYFAEE